MDALTVSVVLLWLAVLALAVLALAERRLLNWQRP